MEESRILIGLQSKNNVMFPYITLLVYIRHFVCKIHNHSLFKQKQQTTFPYIAYYRSQEKKPADDVPLYRLLQKPSKKQPTTFPFIAYYRSQKIADYCAKIKITAKWTIYMKQNIKIHFLYMYIFCIAFYLWHMT